MNLGIRHIPVSVPLGAELARYQAVLEKFPPKVKVGVLGTK